MSPEVMCAQNHSYVVDYFAIGVMGYEFMYGRVRLDFKLASVCWKIKERNKRTNNG